MKPSVPKGTRDFSPSEMVRRNTIFSAIKKVFEKYGYQPIETPAMENLETLMGKYGEEGDRLIFKIFNRGEKLNSAIENIRKEINLPNEGISIPEIPIKELNPKNIDHLSEYIDNNINKLADSALRYDLTVPFARYVVQHQNDITFPFKRYQIQPVWRADRPQKGRYREFFQCDADVIGSNSLLNEVEIVQMIDEVFSLLKIPVSIKINNRKILSGISEVINEKEKIVDITVAVDKLDKIGMEGVNKELKEKGISEEAIQKLQPVISFRGNQIEKLSFLKEFLETSEIGKKGIDEVEYILKTISDFQLSTVDCHLDITLARGLNYYTGSIFEVKANDVQIGSICGGGRYDDLTGIFGLPNVSGVGISFGIDRIYDVMEEMKLFTEIGLHSSTTQIMLAHFGEVEREFCISVASELRSKNINTEIYPDLVKIKKQFDYANKKQIPFVIVIGSEEMQSGQLTLKNMSTGKQEKLGLGEIIARF